MVTRYRGSDDIEQIGSQDAVSGDVIVLKIDTDIAPTPPTDIAEPASIAAQHPRIRVVSSKATEWLETLPDNEILGLVDHDIENPELLPYPGGFVIAGRTTTSERAGKKVALDEHSREVGKLSRVIARNAGIDEILTDICELVGLHHDDGKADPRFQRWLGAGEELLAKSGQTKSQIRATMQASGYPRGQRHELLSAALVDGEGLVPYLVASHHGHCRPFAPPQFDTEPIEVAGEMTDDVVTGHDDRYWSLTRQYGWWLLSLLSSILVVSDHIVSARPAVQSR
jgi:CRISPR-associated helicase Cas3